MLLDGRCDSTQVLHAHSPTLQITDAADIAMGKQFVASDVQTTHYANLIPGIDQGHLRADEGIVEVRLSARDQSSARRAAAGLHIADIGKAFRAQQFVGDVQGCETDIVGYRKSDSGRFLAAPLGRNE